MEKAKVIGVTLIVIGLLIILHHYVLWQRIADSNDIMHHEFFEAVLLTAGITLLISTHYNKNRDAQT